MPSAIPAAIGEGYSCNRLEANSPLGSKPVDRPCVCDPSHQAWSMARKWAKVWEMHVSLRVSPPSMH